MSSRPLPEVGDRIKMDFGPQNPNTWKTAGVVRAVVDGEAIVLRRYSAFRGHYYQLIESIQWTIYGEHFVHTPKKKKSGEKHNV